MEVPVSLLRTRSGFPKGIMGEILDTFPGRTLVMMDRDKVCSPLHLSSAIMHAARSILTGRSRAKAPSMEVLRYLAGSRQVGEGASVVGPGPDTEFVLVAILPEGWPSAGDGDGPPTIIVGAPLGILSGSRIETVDVSNGTSLWGGEGAARRLLGSDIPDQAALEMAILERVAMADL